MNERRLRLLVAEPLSVRAVAQRLVPANIAATIDIDHAADAATLRARLTTEPFDCAVVDLALAGLDPIELLAALRAEDIATPIVLILDPLDDTRYRTLVDAGAFDCLSRCEAGSERLGFSVWNAARRSRPPVAAPVLHDATTGLPNRTLFFDRMERALALAEREGRPMALLLLDLNQFSAVNRAHGFAVGDRLLHLTGARLLRALRHSDSVCRIGDDEFAALLPTGGGFPGAVTTANRLLEAMGEPFAIPPHNFVMTSTIGVALYPQHGANADGLMSCAETALAQAKHDGSGFAVYAGPNIPDPDLRARLTQDMRHALLGDELVLYYQPKIDLADGRVSGVEALARWIHPRLGLVYPDSFISIAEQIGCIDRLTSWVLDAALQQAQRWRRSGLELSVSVNLSAATLHNDDMAEQVEALLAKWQVPAGKLVLEITETAIIADFARARTTLQRLHALGVQLSVDDFGTGYTSLAYLRKLSVSELKIDKSFVLNMLSESDDTVIVRTMIELGRSLGLRVVAEGVEDAATLKELRRLGCHEAQGYYMSRPVDVYGLNRWLAESPWGTGRPTKTDPTQPSRS